MIDVGPRRHALRRVVAASLAEVHGRILVACSGGPDSLALAAVCAALDRPVGAVVVDHQLQPESAERAAAAATACRSLGLDPVRIETVAVTPDGSGPEAAARSARYRALADAAEQLQAEAVLLAHTRDDQAETVLLGLARGSGVRSLAGMPAVRDGFRRPLLGVTRQELRAVLAELDLVAWDDPHNDDPRFTRTRVRHRVLPVLEQELGPGVTAALARTAELARADADALDGWAVIAEAELAESGWSVSAIAALPAAVRTRVLRRAVLSAGAPASDLTAAHVGEVHRLITDWHGQGPLHLPGGVRVGRSADQIVIMGPRPAATAGAEFPTEAVDVAGSAPAGSDRWECRDDT